MFFYAREAQPCMARSSSKLREAVHVLIMRGKDNSTAIAAANILYKPYCQAGDFRQTYARGSRP